MVTGPMVEDGVMVAPGSEGTSGVVMGAPVGGGVGVGVTGACWQAAKIKRAMQTTATAMVDVLSLLITLSISLNEMRLYLHFCKRTALCSCSIGQTKANANRASRG